MAYWLYETVLQEDGALLYTQRRNVRLAGNGLIRSACRELLAADANTGWTVTAGDLLVAADADPDSHALVIDTSPSRSTVSLFAVKLISGYTHKSWTPVMLTLEELFSDTEPPTTAADLKRQFSDSNCPYSVVRSFLYLTGGYAGGAWTWGGNSRTTAALLWEDTWAYFQQQARATDSSA